LQRVPLVSALVPIRPTAIVARPIAEVVPRHGAAALAACVESFLLWFATTRGRRPLTIENYRWDLKSFLAYCAPRGFVYADDLTFRDVEDYLATIQTTRGLKPQTASRHLSCLKAWWVYMLREGVARVNVPSLAFGPKPSPRRIPPFITKAPADHVLAELAKDQTLIGRRDHALTATFLLAGLRNAELCTLRVQDIDLDGGTLYVAHGKGDRDRFVTMPPRLAAILRAYLADVRLPLVGRPLGSLTRDRRRVWRMRFYRDGRQVQQSTGTTDEATARQMLLAAAPQPAPVPWLFVHAGVTSGYRLKRAGQPLLTRSIYPIIQRKVSKLVGRHCWPHLLRHSYAVRLRMAGADLVDIKEEMGHASVATTEIYARIPAADRQKKIARLLEG